MDQALMQGLEDTDFHQSMLQDNDMTRLEWTQQCFGQRPKGKNLSHMSDSFLESCKQTNYFDRLKIDSDEVLSQLEERYICLKCHKSRRYFCYSCLTLSPQLESKLPLVELPVPIDIIKHPKEVDGKSTCPHAALLAPKHVRVFHYPDLPDDWPEDSQKLLLVFPKKTALPLSQYCAQLFESPQLAGGENFPFPFERVVFIDSTWKQAKSIMSNTKRLNDIPAIVLDQEKTLFWRSSVYKRRPSHYLATIEAIYYFLVHLHRCMSDLGQRLGSSQLSARFPEYHGQYDNLLFFFRHTYQTIRAQYQI